MIILVLLYLTRIIPSDNGVIVYIPVVLPYGYFIEGNTCATEDSSNCVWDATTQGNGLGSSFVDVSGSALYIVD